jgi:aspartate/methionine/tyrosine aminotransferase
MMSIREFQLERYFARWEFNAPYLLSASDCETIQPWPMVETETGWHADLAHLAKLLTRKTKLLVINVPHNPTGYLPSAAEFEAILSLASERGLWLFCDEMYRGLEYDEAARLPSASTRYERAISLWGMSKTFGLPGLRIGWLALQDRVVLADLIRWKDYTTICSSAPGEFLARLALEQADAIIAHNLAIIGTNLTQVYNFMAARSDLFAWREPLAGPVAFARLRHGSAAAFCERLLNEQGVLLVPSTIFDFGDSHLRFGLGRRNFPEGLAQLAAYENTSVT